MTEYQRSFGKTLRDDAATAGAAELALSLRTEAVPLQRIRQLVRHMWLRYALAAVLIGGLSVVSYWVVINLNLLNENSGYLVRASAQQLNLAEHIGRLALRLTLPLENSERIATQERLRQAIEELATQYAVLRDGRIEGSLTPGAAAIFSSPPHVLNTRLLAFQELALQLAGEADFAGNEALAADAERLSLAADDLTPALRALVKVYEEDSVGKVYETIETETYVAVVTLLVLVLEIVLIFRPIIGRVRHTALLLQHQVALSEAAALRLEAALHETRTLGERLREEVAHAAQLQRSLLPAPEVNLPGMTGIAILTTCTEVGGDYYDYYGVDGRYAVVIVADASGHGVAAGTLVSSAKIAVQHLAERGEIDPARVLAFINHALLASTHESMFMTMGCLCLDSATGRLHYASAGHVFPYVRRRDGGWRTLEAPGVPLGRVADADYRSVALDLAVGDRVFLYTDGLVEERAPDGELFGFERLEQRLEEYSAMSCDEAAHWLHNALEQHRGAPVLSDDVTLLVLDYTRRTEGHEPASVVTLAAGGALVRLSDAAYRLGGTPLDAHVSRQCLVFLAHNAFTDLLPRFCRDGIRRVLPEDAVVPRALGLPKLLAQHHVAAAEDLYRLVGKCGVQRQFPLSHSDEKAFIGMEIAALLDSQVSAEHAETVQLVVDELIENALYGAPRDPANRPLYAKAEPRDIAAWEGIRLDLALNEEWLGVMVTDAWGTLTPAVFLRRLALNHRRQGLQAGMGGAGLFLAWHLSDYCQIRVFPRQKTQVTVLWHLAQAPDPDAAPGFQFLYHTEADEACLLDELAEALPLAGASG